MKKSYLKILKEYLIVVVLAIILALNYLIFIVNNKFAPSGINGIATMIQYKMGFSVGYFSLIINIPLCIAAFFIVNKGFAIKSFVFCLTYSISYILLGKIDLSAFAYNAGGTDVVLPVLAAGIVSGFVYGEAFKINASSGGTDIIAKLISHKYPAFNFVWIIFILNVIVAAISYFVYGTIDENGNMVYDFKPVILCIIYAFTSSRLGNSLLQGTKTAIKFDIVTDTPDELAEAIMSELHHGVTLTNVKGMYSHKDKELLTCIVNKHQMHDFQMILEKFPNTFAYISTVNNTFGNFKKINTPVIEKKK